jgi:LysM repeat protein
VRYVVRRGDTLSAIAARADTSVGALARLNRLDPAGVLLAGIAISVPAADGTQQPAGGASEPGSLLGLASPQSVRASIDHWAGVYGVDVHLVRAVAWQESGYHDGIVSAAGAIGVMQITPDTWAFAEDFLIGQPVAHTADGNVRVGVALLHHLLLLFGGDERLAVAAYFEGPRAVAQHGVSPQAKVYVDDVLALRNRL